MLNIHIFLFKIKMHFNLVIYICKLYFEKLKQIKNKYSFNVKHFLKLLLSMLQIFKYF